MKKKKKVSKFMRHLSSDIRKLLDNKREDMAMPENFQLSTPWVTQYRKIEAMFGGDPDIKLEYVAGDGEDPVVKMFIDGQDKADAIEKLLPEFYDFGNVKMKVEVIPANKKENAESLFRTAFEGNPAFSYAVTAEGIFTNPITYVVFKNKVVQFWNDDLSDVNGNETTLYEQIAPVVFDPIADAGVCYCTDVPENLGAAAK